MFDPVVADFNRHSRGAERDEDLQATAELFAPCSCGDYDAEDLGDYTIRITCRNPECGAQAERYCGPDYD